MTTHAEAAEALIDQAHAILAKALEAPWIKILQHQLRLERAENAKLRAGNEHLAAQLDHATERAEQTRRLDEERIAELEREVAKLRGVPPFCEDCNGTGVDRNGQGLCHECGDREQLLAEAGSGANVEPGPVIDAEFPSPGELWLDDVNSTVFYAVDVASGEVLSAYNQAGPCEAWLDPIWFTRRIVPAIRQNWKDPKGNRYTIGVIYTDSVMMVDDHGHCCDYTLRQLAELGWRPVEAEPVGEVE